VTIPNSRLYYGTSETESSFGRASVWGLGLGLIRFDAERLIETSGSGSAIRPQRQTLPRATDGPTLRRTKLLAGGNEKSNDTH
jgi:hypothetical protein